MTSQTVSQKRALANRPRRLKTLTRMVERFLRDAREKIAAAAKYEADHFIERRK